METKASQNYNDGYNCAQAILKAYSEHIEDMDEKALLKMFTGFGYGMFTQETCGAVTAAIAVFGMKYGSENPNERQNVKKVYKSIKIFEKEFKEKNCSFNCQELKGVHGKDCMELIKDSASLVEKIIKGDN